MPSRRRRPSGCVACCCGSRPRRRARTHQTTGGEDADIEVFARFRAWWVVYNVVGVWAYITAAWVLAGTWFIATAFGVDLVGAVGGLADWEAIGWVRTVAIGALVTGVLGAVTMAVNYFTAYWRFELARVHHGDTTHLRTRRGLFSTGEVNRDEARVRGLAISEPLLWRWMGMADTAVITTGLGLWSPEQPSAILPRGPISVARPVAGGVLALVAVPVLSGAAPTWLLWAGPAAWPAGLLGAVLAHRSLGHAIHGDYVVMRSGLASRVTSALRREIVSTIAVRQSVLQQRLGPRSRR